MKLQSMIQIVALLALIAFIIMQIIMYVQSVNAIGYINQSLRMSGHGLEAMVANWSITIGLIATFILLGSTNISNKKLTVSAISILLIIACVVMQVISNTEMAQSQPMGCLQSNQLGTGLPIDVDNTGLWCNTSDIYYKRAQLYNNISIMCGILSIAILCINYKF